MVPKSGAAVPIRGNGLAIRERLRPTIRGDCGKRTVEILLSMKAQHRKSVAVMLALIVERDRAEAGGIVLQPRAVAAILGENAGLEEEAARRAEIVQPDRAGDEVESGLAVDRTANVLRHDEVAVRRVSAPIERYAEPRKQSRVAGGDIVRVLVTAF